jgi:hypothetical protein
MTTYPRYSPTATAYLRNVLLGEHPMRPGTTVPIEELSGLATERQLLRPVEAVGATPLDIGDPLLDDAARRLAAWHRRMITRADLYHLSGPLVAHAWACEEQFGPCRFDDAFPSDYGFCVFGQALKLPLNDRGDWTPICAAAWGPIDDCGFLPAVSGPFTEHLGQAGEHQTIVIRERPSKQMHLRLFTYATAMHEGVRGEYPEIIEELDHIVNCNTDIAELPHVGRSNRYAVPRMLRIAFMIATARSLGSDEHQPVSQGLRKRAARLGARPDQQVRVMSLRPRAQQLLHEESQHTSSDGVIERPSRRYTLPLWERRPTRDPETGVITRRGTTCYRHPELLSDEDRDTVQSGTLPRASRGN